MKSIILKPFDSTICRDRGAQVTPAQQMVMKGIVAPATCVAVVEALAPVIASGAHNQFPSCDESIMLNDARQLKAICPFLAGIPVASAKIHPREMLCRN
jgi:hypothetical protein